MSHYTIQIRDNDTGAVIAAQALSADAGSLARRGCAERLADAKADRRDVYVVELRRDASTPKGNPGHVVDKYELLF